MGYKTYCNYRASINTIFHKCSCSVLNVKHNQHLPMFGKIMVARLLTTTKYILLETCPLDIIPGC